MEDSSYDPEISLSVDFVDACDEYWLLSQADVVKVQKRYRTREKKLDNSLIVLGSFDRCRSR